MTQVTVRRIEESWVAKAKAKAADEGVSMNQVLVDAIGKGLGVKSENGSNGLGKFAGSMPFESDEERKQWDEHMEECGRVDQSDWK